MQPAVINATCQRCSQCRLVGGPAGDADETKTYLYSKGWTHIGFCLWDFCSGKFIICSDMSAIDPTRHPLSVLFKSCYCLSLVVRNLIFSKWGFFLFVIWPIFSWLVILFQSLNYPKMKWNHEMNFQNVKQNFTFLMEILK